MYCGTKILAPQTDDLREKQNLERYVELVQVAIGARNYEETIQYCNRILEIDPQNIQAWIDKAISTFWLTTSKNNRYDEAIEYLKKAAHVDPGDERIVSAYKELTRLQARWYNKLGDDAFELALKIWKIYEDDTVFLPDRHAIENSQQYFMQAMNHYMTASIYGPDDLTILGNIATCAKRAGWINWDRAVHVRIRRLESLRAKETAELQLPIMRNTLRIVEELLSLQKKDKGLLAGLKIRETGAQIRKLKSEIAEQERFVAYRISDDE
jgi:tetratricopeptide (TPR) repeat protein